MSREGDGGGKYVREGVREKERKEEVGRFRRRRGGEEGRGGNKGKNTQVQPLRAQLEGRVRWDWREAGRGARSEKRAEMTEKSPFGSTQEG